MYYNTTNLTGQLLMDFSEKAESQEQRVYNFFSQNQFGKYNWSELSAYLPEINEVSLKRCLTDLKDAGKLIKTDIKSPTKYGKLAYKYCLAKKHA